MSSRTSAAAAHLKPRPVQLPSGKWRCQTMSHGERISAVADDPETAHAQVLAMKAGLIQRQKAEKGGTLTLDAALTKYIEDRRPVLSPTTVKSYESMQRCRLQALLKKRVCDITEADLQLAISEEARAGKAAKTIKNDISLACAVLSLYKPVNTRRLKFPQRIRREHCFLDTAEIVKLIEGCRGDWAEIPILLALWLGLRRSEILGLPWSSVDFENGRLSIEQVLILNDEKEYVINRFTKNESSRRTVSCPAYILDKLAALPGPHTGLIFTGHHPNSIYDRLKIICAREGITFPGVHGLRHTNASVMLSLGIMDKYAMARGGWSTDYTMKNVYQHLFSADQNAADLAIDAYFGDLLHTDLHTKKAGA